MDIQNFIAEFKKTFVYDLLSMTLKDEQLFEHFVDCDKVIWFKEQTRQMWEMWQQAQKVAVPEGFVLVEKSKLLQILGSAVAINTNPKTKINLSESDFIVSQVKSMIEAQEQTDISKFDGYTPIRSRSKEPTHD